MAGKKIPAKNFIFFPSTEKIIYFLTDSLHPSAYEEKVFTMPKRAIIEILTEEFRFTHSSPILGPFIDDDVAKRYKLSPLHDCREETGDDDVVFKGADNCYESVLFDASNNPYVTVRAVKKVNEIERHCRDHNEFKTVAGKHGAQLGEIWCTAEMFDLQKTMDFVSETMRRRVLSVYKKFITDVICSERSDEELNNAIIDFFQRKLSESETWYGVRTTQNHKITMSMIGEHHWIPHRVLDNIFFKSFNDETKVRRFGWLVNTLRWFPVVTKPNECFIATAYHHPTYLTYTLWRFESGFDQYKFDMACKILDKYLHYDHRLVDKDREFCVRRWDWLVRWGHMLPVATRIKLLGNIERHKYTVNWVCDEGKTYNPHWDNMGNIFMNRMEHAMRSSITVFLKALGCQCIGANLYLLYREQCQALVHETRIQGV